ncbi:MAG: hypothetical protein FJ265_09355 [Planctomycetes bacterium]|nr:hypothetical protein [Planctomycetota bacterium]
MSCADLAGRLERSFRTSSALLRRLAAGLQARRTAWASARPGTLQPPAELEQLALDLAAEAKARAQLLGQLAAVLPLPPGAARGDLHVNVTRIAAAVPGPAGRALRSAADEAVGLARTVRVEVQLGARLLRFTQRAHDRLLGQVAAEAAADGGAQGYDRSARARGGLDGSGGAGRLVDGRI